MPYIELKHRAKYAIPAHYSHIGQIGSKDDRKVKFLVGMKQFYHTYDMTSKLELLRQCASGQSFSMFVCIYPETIEKVGFRVNVQFFGGACMEKCYCTTESFHANLLDLIFLISTRFSNEWHQLVHGGQAKNEPMFRLIQKSQTLGGFR